MRPGASHVLAGYRRLVYVYSHTSPRVFENKADKRRLVLDVEHKVRMESGITAGLRKYVRSATLEHRSKLIGPKAGWALLDLGAREEAFLEIWPGWCPRLQSLPG